MKVKKSTVLFFAALITAVFFTACATEKSEDQNTTAASGDLENEQIAAAAEEDIFAGIAANTCEGRVFNILARENFAKQFDSEEETGDIINDSIYKRNRTVEEKFDALINVIVNPGDWNDQIIRKSVTAGDGAYDLIDGYAAYVGNLVGAGLYLNLLDIPHLRLTERWWSQHAVDELTVNGKLFVVPGDITINLWETIMTIFFSKGLLKDLNLENPYSLVINGDWTFGKMLEMCKNASADLNGDGQMYTEDRYGSLIYDDLSFVNFHNAFDIPTTKKNDNGIPYFNLGSPEVFELAEMMYNLASSTEGVIYGNRAEGFNKMYTSGYPIVETSLNMFANDQILFYLTTLGDAEKLRSMETDFGILPYPKKSADQAQYKTSSRDQHTMFGIPVDVKDEDFAGLITEALCVASNKIVIPTYYEIALKSKYARDDESQEMLDIIRQGLNFDFGIVFSAQTNNAGWMIRASVNESTFKFASTYEKNAEKHDKALDKFLAAFE
ncbi:MAG: hypothetical protein FWD23_10585 [Oscillospiraceae bacterium]|nr:hypothetical protein [Oscillospiraceae bacterium]